MSHLKLPVQIKANASENQVLGWVGDRLKIKIKATPTKGKANEVLVAYLATWLAVSKQHIHILSGHTSSKKLLLLEGMSEEVLQTKLKALLAG